MDFFELPSRTKVGRVIPKNTFDNVTNTRQKKQFVDYIHRITWTHKLSPDTINLPGKDLEEIQVFRVELKLKSDISKLLGIINKSIPYHIVFWIEFDQEAYISTAKKHPHPANENVSVVDWTFNSSWFRKEDNHYSFKLKGDLDSVFKDLCVQISGKADLAGQQMDSIVKNQQEIDQLRKKISKLEAAIKSNKQFNKRVELNIDLKKAEKQLKSLL